MNSPRTLLPLLLCLIFTAVVFGEPTWVQIRDSQPNPPQTTLVNNTVDSIVFIVTIPGFFKEDTTYDKIEYQRLRFIEESVLSDSGFPELPIIYRLVAIPECDSVFITVNAYNPHYFTGYYLLGKC